MNDPWFPVAAVLFMVVTLVVAYRSDKKKERQWQEIAARRKWRYSDITGGFALRGTIQAFEFSVEVDGSGDGPTSTRYRLSGDRIGVGLSLTLEGSFSRFFGATDLQTGDVTFDRKMKIHGDARVAAAVLGAKARSLFLSDEPAIEVAEGFISLSRQGKPKEREIMLTLNQLVERAMCLNVEKSEIPQRILANLRSEAVPTAAMWFLRTLVDRYPASEEVRAGLEFAVKQTNLDLRHFAAYASNSTDRRLHMEAAASVTTEIKVRLWAISELRKSGASEETFAALYPLLDAVHPEEIRLAALDALAEIGTRECVEKILPHSEGVFADGSVRARARSALAKIQSRLGPADAGRISVVEPTAGEGAISAAKLRAEKGAIAEMTTVTGDHKPAS